MDEAAYTEKQVDKVVNNLKMRRTKHKTKIFENGEHPVKNKGTKMVNNVLISMTTLLACPS